LDTGETGKNIQCLVQAPNEYLGPLKGAVAPKEYPLKGNVSRLKIAFCTLYT
jgi:hypothetical protein